MKVSGSFGKLGVFGFLAISFLTLKSSDAQFLLPVSVRAPTAGEIEKRAQRFLDQKKSAVEIIEAGQLRAFFFNRDSQTEMVVDGFPQVVSISSGTKFLELDLAVQKAVLELGYSRAFVDLGLEHNVNTPWLGGMYPDLEFRLYALFFSFDPAFTSPLHDPAQSEDRVIESLKKLEFKEVSEAEKQTYLDNFKTDKKEEFLIRSAWKLYCPSESGILAKLKCVQMMGSVAHYLFPYNLERFVAVPSHMELSFNKKYFFPVREVAVQMLQAIKDLRLGNGDYSLNLFEMLKSEFKKSGLSDKEAMDSTFEVLAVYGSRGPNVYSVYRSETIAALHILATAINVMDSYYGVVGKSFSLPRSIEGALDIGKSYHFWLPAALAYRLTTDPQSRVAARNAATVPALFYQMEKISNGRDNCEYMFVEDSNLINQKRRLDLVFAFSGADFGSKAAVQNVTSVRMDQLFDELFVYSGVFPGIAEKEPKEKWHQRFCYDLLAGEKPNIPYTVLKTKTFYQLNNISGLYKVLDGNLNR
jgi:hypothetical protein